MKNNNARTHSTYALALLALTATAISTQITYAKDIKITDNTDTLEHIPDIMSVAHNIKNKTTEPHTQNNTLSTTPIYPQNKPEDTPTPPDFKQLFEQANQHFANKNYDLAIADYEKSIMLNPSICQSHFNLGVAYEHKGDLKNAINGFENAIDLNSSYTRAYIQLAKALKKQNKITQAIESFKKAVTLDPSDTENRLEFARALCENQEYDYALEQFNLLVQAKPDDVRFQFERANTLNTLNRTEEALPIYEELLSKQQNNTSIAYNIAYTLKKLGRVQDAMPYYELVLKQKPDHTEANFSLGLAHLISGNFTAGWDKYEWRWRRSDQSNSSRSYPQPIWDGSDLQGKTIFLYGEQGLGDTFQFIRYARIAKERGGHVIVAVQNPLLTIISQCEYVDKVIPLNQTPPPFDTYAALMSLPHILGTTIDTVPDEIPYLKAHATLIEKWRNILAKDTNFKIGICWQGNDKYSTPFLRTVVAAKSVALKEFAPLATIPGVSVYSLQKNTGVEQLKSLPDYFDLHTFDGDFDETNGRFMDTAAVMKNLDMVITVDTSISHFSAALGVPTWVLIPNPPDWRWMLDRNDTPWYPENMRLFRQPTPGDWDSVIETIAYELNKKLGNPPLPAMSKNLTSKETETNNCPDNTSNMPEQKRGYTQQVPSSQQLKQELAQEIASIEQKLADLGDKLGLVTQWKSGSHSLNSELIADVRSFYLLSELHNTLAHKIELL